MSFELPPSLNLPPHLSAHKYFFVCTLTVAAWDTLVLSPRTWRLFKTPEWPVLKALFYVLRFLMPIEFAIVGASLLFEYPVHVPVSHFHLQRSHFLTPISHKMCVSVPSAPVSSP